MRKQKIVPLPECHSDFTMTDYFLRKIEHDREYPALPVRRTRCDDCAITTGFYTPFARALKKEPLNVRRTVSEKWFCHETPGCACRGNWEVQGFDND